jgi:hypothetical protein
MLNVEQILAQADGALAKASIGEPTARREAIGKLMQCFEQLAREVAQGVTSWEAVRSWAQQNAERVRAARQTIKAWDAETGDMFYSPSGGEEEAEAVLKRRSRLAFAAEVFRGTSAAEALAGLESEEFDRDLHEEAARLELFAPSYIPRSHHWWASVGGSSMDGEA